MRIKLLYIINYTKAERYLSVTTSIFSWSFRVSLITPSLLFAHTYSDHCHILVINTVTSFTQPKSHYHLLVSVRTIILSCRLHTKVLHNHIQDPRVVRKDTYTNIHKGRGVFLHVALPNYTESKNFEFHIKMVKGDMDVSRSKS